MSGKTFTAKFRSVKDLKEEKLIKWKDEIDKHHILLSNKMAYNIVLASKSFKLLSKFVAVVVYFVFN